MLRVADTILEQLGGNRFIVMTGAHGFVADEKSLRMCLPRNASKANRLTITLTPMDTYDMEFVKYTPYRISTRGGQLREYHEKWETIREFEGIYFDQLQELFTEVTGLYTHL